MISGAVVHPLRRCIREAGSKNGSRGPPRRRAGAPEAREHDGQARFFLTATLIEDTQTDVHYITYARIPGRCVGPPRWTGGRERRQPARGTASFSPRAVLRRALHTTRAQHCTKRRRALHGTEMYIERERERERERQLARITPSARSATNAHMHSSKHKHTHTRRGQLVPRFTHTQSAAGGVHT